MGHGDAGPQGASSDAIICMHGRNAAATSAAQLHRCTALALHLACHWPDVAGTVDATQKPATARKRLVTARKSPLPCPSMPLNPAHTRTPAHLQGGAWPHLQLSHSLCTLPQSHCQWPSHVTMAISLGPACSAASAAAAACAAAFCLAAAAGGLAIGSAGLGRCSGILNGGCGKLQGRGEGAAGGSGGRCERAPPSQRRWRRASAAAGGSTQTQLTGTWAADSCRAPTPCSKSGARMVVEASIASWSRRHGGASAASKQAAGAHRPSAHRHGLGWPHAQLSHNLSVLPQLQRQSPLLRGQREQETPEGRERLLEGGGGGRAAATAGQRRQAGQCLARSGWLITRP